MTSTINKGIILHDFIQVNGGSEKLVISLAKNLPNFSLLTSGIYQDFTEMNELESISYRVASNLDFIPRVLKALLFFSFLIPKTNSNISIYSGIYSPLAVFNRRYSKNIYYCHTPPRFIFDRKIEYLTKVPFLLRLMYLASFKLYKFLYLSSLRRMDIILTNSLHMQSFIKAIVGFDSIVVYPPIDNEAIKWIGQSDYYLSLGRLEPNKRIEKIVKAFLKMPNKKLIVTSGGSQLSRLQEIAKNAPNIQFTSWVTKSKLNELIGNSIACIYIPREEDFGMSAVEAMAAGKPVITVAEGGIPESVIHLKTGFMLNPNPDIEQIMGAVKFISQSVALTMKSDCEASAKKFSEMIFIKKINNVINAMRI